MIVIHVEDDVQIQVVRGPAPKPARISHDLKPGKLTLRAWARGEDEVVVALRRREPRSQLELPLVESEHPRTPDQPSLI